MLNLANKITLLRILMAPLVVVLLYFVTLAPERIFEPLDAGSSPA